MNSLHRTVGLDRLGRGIPPQHRRNHRSDLGNRLGRDRTREGEARAPLQNVVEVDDCFPLDTNQVRALLDDLADRVAALRADEAAALDAARVLALDLTPGTTAAGA